MTITRQQLKYNSYQRVYWWFSKTRNEAASLSYKDGQHSVCYAYTFGAFRKWGVGEKFWMGVYIYPEFWDYKEKFILDTIDVFSKAVPNAELIISDKGNRVIFPINYVEEQNKQGYFTFIVTLRHACELLRDFPIQENPPSIEEVLYRYVEEGLFKYDDVNYYANVGNRNHCSFVEPSWTYIKDGFTYKDYVDRFLQIWRENRFPPKKYFESITVPGKPTVRNPLYKMIIKEWLQDNKLKDEKEGYNPWE